MVSKRQAAIEEKARKDTQARGEREYRKGINMDYEGVASNAKAMGVNPYKSSNEAVRKANREFDYQEQREATRGIKPKKIDGWNGKD